LDDGFDPKSIRVDLWLINRGDINEVRITLRGVARRCSNCFRTTSRAHNAAAQACGVTDGVAHDVTPDFTHASAESGDGG